MKIFLMLTLVFITIVQDRFHMIVLYFSHNIWQLFSCACETINYRKPHILWCKNIKRKIIECIELDKYISVGSEYKNDCEIIFSEDNIIKLINKDESINKNIKEKNIKKKIYIKNKILNIII